MIPISILTTIASSLVGWIQVKRYSELSASILTAHEIGVIKEQASYVSSESDFSSFIRDAETAFSREHTQWIARRVANRKPK
ncbi:SLATT domain-containing protein [Klebsiella pneumoniae]|uniref:SLATT domain-containing protein n=1 Tax=Klebsiella pneumoniae TaxID=573 RepID=A0A927HS05_KLEPN|nr:SLATT domain-containing protein [Klebsiella pneumoniae]